MLLTGKVFNFVAIVTLGLIGMLIKKKKKNGLIVLMDEITLQINKG